MKKKLTLLVAFVLVFALGVAGTFAYLTSSATVTNTFTVGKVAITLDEQDVDNSTEGKDRDTANAYNLLPGHTYTKDPIIHVDADSENSWVFVKVENGIAAYEATTVENGYKSINDQILANGWTLLSNGVYYQTYTKGQADKDLEVFGEFKVADEANKVSGWSDITAESTKIVVTGYAIQSDGFTTAQAAWAEVSK